MSARFWRGSFHIIAAATLLLAATPGFAGATPARYAATGGETSVPYGWIDFCQRYRGECHDDFRAARDIDLTPANLRKISRVNAFVNDYVKAVADSDHWGAIDQWDYPNDGKGDCEDFALLKRRMLIAEGFPREALLLTVVKEKNGDGHSILTVKTNRGDYVLDNLTDGVKPWTSAPYRFVKRQSQQNQNVWVAIGPPTSAPEYVSK